MEKGVSGGQEFNSRPEGSRLLASLSSGDIVIFPKLDRGFRNTRDALNVLHTLKEKGVSVHSIDLGGDVTGNGVGAIIFTILSAVGRAMRKPRGSDKEVGYIVVPIFAEDTSEQSLEKAIKSEDFDDVIVVLNALLEQDDEFNEQIKIMTINLGRTENPTIEDYNNKIELLAPTISKALLETSISICVLRKLSSTWFEWLGRLQSYVRNYGDSRVNSNYISPNGFKLGSWVQQQRKLQNKLSKERNRSFFFAISRMPISRSENVSGNDQPTNLPINLSSGS